MFVCSTVASKLLEPIVILAFLEYIAKQNLSFNKNLVKIFIVSVLWSSCKYDYWNKILKPSINTNTSK